jgi:hypothetical protein
LPRKRDLPDGLTDAARRKRAQFNEVYKGFLKEREEIALSVLVWGPDPKSKSPVSKKRKEIRAELLKNGHDAKFSEEISTDGDDRASQKAKELAQAQAADVLIILVEGSPGALAETHDFCGRLEIAPKVLVLVPVEYKKGFSGSGLLSDLKAFGGVHWYKPTELTSCNVLGVAVGRVEARRNLIFCAR